FPTPISCTHGGWSRCRPSTGRGTQPPRPKSIWSFSGSSRFRFLTCWAKRWGWDTRVSSGRFSSRKLPQVSSLCGSLQEENGKLCGCNGEERNDQGIWERRRHDDSERKGSRTRTRIVVAIFPAHAPAVGGITRATFRRACPFEN